MGETKREKRQLVEDFRRFSQIRSLICKVSGLEPQETAGNRSKQFDPFLSHLVSPIKCCPCVACEDEGSGLMRARVKVALTCKGMQEAKMTSLA